jgi:hypothetical protein
MRGPGRRKLQGARSDGAIRVMRAGEIARTDKELSDDLAAGEDESLLQ